MNSHRFFFGKVRISAINMESALELIDKKIREKKSAYICVINLNAAIPAQKNETFCNIQNESYLTLPDGMPLVWYAKLAGFRHVDRITGPDLLIKLLKLSSKKRYSHYFYGDTEETLSKMTKIISKKYSGAKIVGTFSPPFRTLSDDEIKESVKKINELHPSFLWVAMGTPKQEYIIKRMMPDIENTVVIGVGAAFRFIIGEYKHPPKIMQQCGLEGVFWRFMKEPFGEAKWYLFTAFKYGMLLVNMLIKKRS